MRRRFIHSKMDFEEQKDREDVSPSQGVSNGNTNKVRHPLLRNRSRT